MRLGTNYLGFNLSNPLVPGASPMCDDLDFARKLEDCGAPMLTLRSLFQEQIAEEPRYTEASAYLDEDLKFRNGPEDYLAHIARLKLAVGVPVVASLNCQTSGPWVEYAKLIEEAGADALELNIFSPVVRFDQTSEQIERQTVAMVAAVREAVNLPLAVKLLPNYTALPHLAMELTQAGAQALVLFSRLYQPEMDLEHLGLRQELTLSKPAALALRLRAVAVLAGRVRCDLALSGGARSAADVLRATLAGANAVQMVSALLNEGPFHIGRVLIEMERWLDTHNFEFLSQVRGTLSLLRTPAPKAIARTNLISVINQWQASASTG